MDKVLSQPTSGLLEAFRRIADASAREADWLHGGERECPSSRNPRMHDEVEEAETPPPR
jgi:hypothetical protein